MRKLKRVGLISIVGLTKVLVALALVGFYWRADKTGVFFRLRGTYREAELVSSWETTQSRVRLVQLRNHRGYAVARAYVRRPIELSPDYQIFVTYAGAKTGQAILDLIPERPDLVLVGVQYPYTSPRGAVEYLRWPYDLRQAGFRTVAGGMLAVSFLIEDENLDARRLTVIGASLGYTVATIHAALDERVAAVILIHGGGDLPTVVPANIRSRWLAVPVALFTAFVAHSFDAIDYVDRISPRKLVMIASRNDKYFPVESLERFYARANEPKEIIWTRTDHVRSQNVELVAEIVAQIEACLAAQAQP